MRAVVGLVVVFACSVANAQPANKPSDKDIEAAKAYSTAGASYYANGQYDKAIAEFQEAYRLTKLAGFLYNIAQAYEKLNDLPHAREYLKKYMDSGQTEAGELPSLQEKLRSIDGRIAEDEKKKKEQEAAANANKPPIVDASPPPEPPQRPFKVAKWVVAAVGVACVGAATFFAIDASSQNSKIQDAANKTPPTPFGPDLSDAYDAGRRDNTLAIVFGISGGVLVATGVIFFVLDAKAPRETARVSVVPVVTPRTAGATAIWRF
jgi:tetratricopeptide (TPR) repeat protein